MVNSESCWGIQWCFTVSMIELLCCDDTVELWMPLCHVNIQSNNILYMLRSTVSTVYRRTKVGDIFFM